MPAERVDSQSFEVFSCYSHTDSELLKELLKHLSSLRREGIITSWHDRKIVAGREIGVEIDRHINSANIILLMVSPDFVDSDYCWHIEMKRALERHKLGEARVIPIILRPVDWGEAPFRGLKALPQDGKPVTSWKNQDEAFLDVAKNLRDVCREMTGEGDRRFDSEGSASTGATVTREQGTFCARCGAKMGGQSTECIGIYTAHKFQEYGSQPYCSRCGIKAGKSTACTGSHLGHDFEEYSSQPYCSRCGIKAGQSTECIGMYTAHKFQEYGSQPYCSRCGIKAGKSTACTGSHLGHDFEEYSSQPYCSRCGIKAGQSTECVGMYTAHKFVSS